jgi:hypothetical protein
MSDLSLSCSFKFQKTTAQPMSAAPQFNGLTIGDKAIENKIIVTSTDVALDLGSLSSIGSFFVFNLATALPPPAADPVITQGGAAGTTSYTYLLVFHYADGSLSISNAIATALGNATLNVTNYNILTWTNPAGVTSADVYRTVSSGTPATIGKIGTGSASPFSDTGLAGDGSAVPATIASNYSLEYGPTSGDYPCKIDAGRWAEGQWNAAAMHFKALPGPPSSVSNLQYLLVEP